ncbi:ComEC/Rec2 family competence protein [uncultured Bacteroides sp.]|uniref:ComEC/Rec2 family competence protein n=1 Tax=uncultured Bacteroides sp. TaxID=162156 RepID=UPI002AA7CEFA|nr:ComEC/Rec2 family competence protein [uncultured Bacteroides sp.]
MLLSDTIHRYNFLRLILPLAIGIVCGDALSFLHLALLLPLVCLSFGLSLLLSASSFFIKKYFYRWLFGLGVYLLFFSIGMGSSGWKLRQTNCYFPAKETVYRGLLTEKPEVKEHSVLCRIRLSEEGDSVLRKPFHQNVLLYFSKDSASEQMLRGDELLFSARISIPKNNGNPDEFDYVRYLLRKGISGTGFVYSGNWKVVANHNHRSFSQLAADWRGRVLDTYRTLGFSGDDFAVLSALTVGYKDELSDEVKESFSVSGASHVLALSGLHIGFLYALLLLLLKGIPDRSNKLKLLRVAIVIAVLWAFAFLTGFSPSVVRSVIMFSLFALSGFFSGKSLSMNALAAAGVAMLLYNPCWLFDVGFQLSFCAVAAILLLHPFIYSKFSFSSLPMKYLWGLISISIVAQIGTAPLVILYFSRFSTYFLLTNILVIPLVSIIMFLAIAMLLLSPFPSFQIWLKEILQYVLQRLNGSVRWVEQLPFSSINDLWVYPLEVFGIYLSILLFIWYLAHRTGRCLFAFLFSLFLLCSYHTAMLYKDRPQESLVFYHLRNCPVVHCIANDGKSWLVYADSLPDEHYVYAAVSPHWKRMHISRPISVIGSGCKGDCIFRNKILFFHGKRVCFVNDDRWLNKEAMKPLFIDYLYLCKGYGGRLEWLTGLFSIQTVILDASIPDWRKEQLTKECRHIGIRFISLADEGSVGFLL